MVSKQVKHDRIVYLHNIAKKGKYTWKDLRALIIRNYKVSDATAKNYLDEVEERLKKEGLLPA